MCFALLLFASSSISSTGSYTNNKQSKLTLHTSVFYFNTCKVWTCFLFCVSNTILYNLYCILGFLSLPSGKAVAIHYLYCNFLSGNCQHLIPRFNHFYCCSHASYKISLSWNWKYHCYCVPK